MSAEPLTDELIEAIRTRSIPDPIPPCRVCGGGLSIQSMGGGRATEYACSAPPGVSIAAHSDHYQRSMYIHVRQGNPDALLLIAEVERLKGERAGK